MKAFWLLSPKGNPPPSHLQTDPPLPSGHQTSQILDLESIKKICNLDKINYYFKNITSYLTPERIVFEKATSFAKLFGWKQNTLNSVDWTAFSFSSLHNSSRVRSVRSLWASTFEIMQNVKSAKPKHCLSSILTVAYHWDVLSHKNVFYVGKVIFEVP